MSYKHFSEDLEIYVVEDFLSEQELSLLDKEISEANLGGLWSSPMGNTTKVNTWEGRTYFSKNHDLILQIYNKVVDFYSENIGSIEGVDISEVFMGIGPINRTQVGGSLPAHDDLGPPELNAPVEYGVVLYLNDDYSGGELYYSELDLEIAPKRGMLVVHGATKQYTHGVREVTSGTRYGLTMFINRLDI
jgi:hypothetical protein